MNGRWALSTLLFVGLFAACAAPAPVPNRLTPSREDFVRTDDGTQLALRIEGNGPDTVVVLHGGPGFSGESLRPDLAPLAREFTLIFYDQRGSGYSSAIDDSTRISVAHHVSDLEAVRRHFGLDRMVLLGHSWGGGLALHYTVAHPQRTARMVLIDPMPLRRDPYMAQFGARLGEWMDSATLVQLDVLSRARATAADPAAACRAYHGLFIRGYLAAPHGNIPVRGDPCYGSVETINNKVFRYTLGPQGAWDWRENARQVRAPVLILQGAQSPLPLESFIEWEEVLPNGRRMAVEGSGHFPHAEQPAIFFAAAIPFLHGTSHR